MLTQEMKTQDAMPKMKRVVQSLLGFCAWLGAHLGGALMAFTVMQTTTPLLDAVWGGLLLYGLDKPSGEIHNTAAAQGGSSILCFGPKSVRKFCSQGRVQLKLVARINFFARSASTE